MSAKNILELFGIDISKNISENIVNNISENILENRFPPKSCRKKDPANKFMKKVFPTTKFPHKKI